MSDDSHRSHNRQQQAPGAPASAVQPIGIDSVARYGAVHTHRVVWMTVAMLVLLSGWIVVHQLVVPDVGRLSMIVLGGFVIPHTLAVTYLFRRFRPSVREYGSLYSIMVAFAGLEYVFACSRSEARPYAEGLTGFILLLVTNVTLRYQFRAALTGSALVLAGTSVALLAGGTNARLYVAWLICAVAIAAATLYANFSAAQTERYYIRQQQNLELVLSRGLHRLIEIEAASDTLTAYSSAGAGLRPAVESRAAYLRCVHPDDRAMLSGAVLACLEGRADDVAVQYRVQRPGDRDWRWIELSGRAERNETGAVVKLRGISCDITDRRLLHERVERQAIALEQLAGEKANFLATMNHSIRTPLNAVIGAASLLAAEDSSEELRAAMETIEWSGHALISLLHETLDLDAFQTGAAQLKPVPFEPLVLLDHCAHLIEPLARRKGLEVRRSASPELAGVSLLGDPVRLQQILTNLLSNAVKFCDRGFVRLAAQGRPGPDHGLTTIRFEVADTGQGIDEQARHSLFQRFEQAHQQTLTGPVGTGLGLAISHRLVAAMGGELQCASELGKGSRFVFTLSFPAARPQVRHCLSAAPLARLRVLVAEDNRVNQRVLRGILERLNCEVTIAANGAEAVEACRHACFDIVFMDCDMPVMDGIEATRCIHRLPGRNGLPVVAVTAHSLASNIQACLGAGMSAVLTKPVSLEQLREALQRWPSSAPADSMVATPGRT